MDTNFGVVTEQGDLGLGFTPITEEEKQKIEANKEEADKEHQK